MPEFVGPREMMTYEELLGLASHSHDISWDGCN
jgi:hypothetical protein